MKLSVDTAREITETTMVTVGYSTKEAALIADHLLDCELRGLAFGGLARAVSVTERRRATPPPAPVTVIKESTVSAVLDGGDQVGYVVGRRAADLAVTKASTSGIALVGARNTWFTGMFSYYLEIFAAAGLAGLIAGSGGHIVAPHGGTEGRFATNPIAFGFPSDGTPVIWDIGTSSIMLGEVLVAAMTGRPLPEGTAYDSDGRPTRDPVTALGGALTVWGGHKGPGLDG